MEIDLPLEDQQHIDRLINQGRFSSVIEVIHASLSLMQADADWKQYAQERIEAGLKAAEHGDFAREEEVDALFAKYQRKSA